MVWAPRRVANALFASGCRMFFVATPQEAFDLRNELRQLKPPGFIAVLNGLLPETAEAFEAAAIIPTLGSLAEIEIWRRRARSSARNLPALVHIDTGMNRLGLDPTEVARLVADPSLLAGIDLLAIMTHLVSSERPDDPLNSLQLARFHAARAGLPPAPTSIANSSGLFLSPAFHSDLARPGAALYGINPTPARPNPMRTAVRLRARVLRVRDVAAGDTVGYNGCWTAARPSRIATLPVGYADGYLRTLTNRGMAHFDGRPVPLVGRVSMDLTTFDITDHPAIGAGSWLDLIGPENPPDAVAEAAGTNGYEILTSLGARYQRRYLTA